MTRRQHRWVLLATALLGMPALFGAFNLIAYQTGNRPVGSKSMVVYIACIVTGMIIMSLVPFPKTWQRIAATLVYAIVMAIGLLFVSLWVGCANDNCI